MAGRVLMFSSTRLLKETLTKHSIQKKCYLQTGVCLCAGHSKWQNIRHIKSAKDKDRASYTSKIVDRMNLAIREGGGTDPQFNRQLERIMEEAEKNNVPKSTLLNCVKRAETKSKDGKMIYVEMMGPGNCYLVSEVVTDKPNRARQLVQSVIKTVGGRVVEKGMSKHSFDFKGVLHIPCDGDDDLDEAMEIAIETGAEDVKTIVNENNDKLYQFVTDPKELHIVAKNLEAAGKKVVHAKLEFLPIVYAKLNEVQQQAISHVLDKLDNISDPVIQTYDNIESA